MYTIADITAGDRAKIRPGLSQELEKIPSLPPDVSIVDLDKQDRIDADVLLTTTDGKTYYIRGSDLPMSWTTAEWVDFVVTLLKAPNTSKVGIVREWPFVEAPFIWPWQNWQWVSTTTSMLMLAGVPPEGEGPVGGEGGPNWPLIAALVGGGLLLFVVLRRRE